MITTINNWTEAVTAIGYVTENNDIAAVSDADRGELLRMLDERGHKLESAGKGVMCFRFDGQSLAVETNGKHATVREMEEEDLQEILLGDSTWNY